MGIIEEIEDCNGNVQEHATTLEQGLAMLGHEKTDACILNIRLGPDMVYELADRLIALGIHVIFASSEAREHILQRLQQCRCSASRLI